MVDSLPCKLYNPQVYIPKIVWSPISVGGLDFEYVCSPCQTFLYGGGPKILSAGWSPQLQKQVWTYSTTTSGNFLALFYRTTWVIRGIYSIQGQYRMAGARLLQLQRMFIVV